MEVGRKAILHFFARHGVWRPIWRISGIAEVFYLGRNREFHVCLGLPTALYMQVYPTGGHDLRPSSFPFCAQNVYPSIRD
jgi:hypothetical protein